MLRKVLLLSVVLLILISCQSRKSSEYIKESGTRFHTFYHITYRSEKSLSDAIDSTMTAFNASLNPFDSTSLIARINRNETDSVDGMLMAVIRKSLEVSRITSGAYDITGGPLFDAWGFGVRKGVRREATPAEIDSIKAFVGYRNLILDTLGYRIAKTDPRLQINPSSLSKGYVTDLVARTLESHGVEDYMVEIGGEIVCRGRNPQGECWQIGINKPVEDSSSEVNEVMGKLPLCDHRGLATSGDYRNYKLLPNGHRVAHTIDVRTGYPSHQDILSATVVAPSCMEADAWATAFMSLGLDSSQRLLDSLPCLSVLFIYADSTGVLRTYERGVDYQNISSR